LVWQTEQLRSLLHELIDTYTKQATIRATQDRYFSGAVEMDLADLDAKKAAMTPDEFDHEMAQILKDANVASTAEREGRAMMTVAETLKYIATLDTKAQMIAMMEHYVLEFGRTMAKAAKADDDAKGITSSMVTTTLNKLLSEVKGQ
jgi:hypothetical protein